MMSQNLTIVMVRGEMNENFAVNVRDCSFLSVVTELLRVHDDFVAAQCRVTAEKVLHIWMFAAG